MEALEFARELKRMCESHSKGCSICDLYVVGKGTLCDIGNLEKAVPTVEKWSKEHPKVRNVDHVAEGLEKLGYKVGKEYLIKSCCPPNNSILFGNGSCSYASCCEECRKWWLEEYKGVENE